MLMTFCSLDLKPSLRIWQIRAFKDKRSALSYLRVLHTPGALCIKPKGALVERHHVLVIKPLIHYLTGFSPWRFNTSVFSCYLTNTSCFGAAIHLSLIWAFFPLVLPIGAQSFLFLQCTSLEYLALGIVDSRFTCVFSLPRWTDSLITFYTYSRECSVSLCYPQ